MLKELRLPPLLERVRASASFMTVKCFLSPLEHTFRIRTSWKHCLMQIPRQQAGGRDLVVQFVQGFRL